MITYGITGQKAMQVKASYSSMIISQHISPSPKALTKDSPPVEPGLLTAEAITWKSLKPLSVVLRIHTYATKASVVRLPAGYGLTSCFLV
jgi:hypothetical protein